MQFNTTRNNFQTANEIDKKNGWRFVPSHFSFGKSLWVFYEMAVHFAWQTKTHQDLLRYRRKKKQSLQRVFQWRCYIIYFSYSMVKSSSICSGSEQTDEKRPHAERESKWASERTETVVRFVIKRLCSAAGCSLFTNGAGAELPTVFSWWKSWLHSTFHLLHLLAIMQWLPASTIFPCWCHCSAAAATVADAAVHCAFCTSVTSTVTLLLLASCCRFNCCFLCAAQRFASAFSNSIWLNLPSNQINIHTYMCRAKRKIVLPPKRYYVYTLFHMVSINKFKRFSP